MEQGTSAETSRSGVAWFFDWLRWLTFLVLGHIVAALGGLFLFISIVIGKQPWNSREEFLTYGLLLGMFGGGVWICRHYIYGRKRRPQGDESPAVAPAYERSVPRLMSEVEGLGGGSFWNTEAQYIASRRALGMALNPAYDGWALRLAFGLLGHLLVIVGVDMFFRVLQEMRQRPWSFGAVVVLFGVAPGILAAGLWMCDRYVYGRKRRLRREFRTFPGADERVEVAFTPNRLHSHSPTSDFRVDWSLFPTVVELRDGFVLLTQARTGVWLPKHAFQPPFDAEAAGAFLRDKIAKDKRLNRVARLGE